MAMWERQHKYHNNHIFQTSMNKAKYKRTRNENRIQGNETETNNTAAEINKEIRP
jgi:hypothetical protein